MSSSIQVLPNQVSKKSFHTFEDIDLRESHAKLHKNRVKLREWIQFKDQKSPSAVFLRTLADFRCILHSIHLQKSKVHVLSLKISHYQKILAKNYL